MITAVQPAGSPEPSPTDQAALPAPVAERRQPIPPQPESNVRLTIDAAEDGPYFVYTLQDRATGRIIVQLPQHRVQAVGERPDYHAGDVVRARA